MHSTPNQHSFINKGNKARRMPGVALFVSRKAEEVSY
jgi:hypothetical protein